MGRPADNQQQLPHQGGGHAVMIPRRILQIWQGNDLPDSVEASSSSWTQANPGYEHSLWCDADASRFLAERAPEQVRQAFAKAASPLLRADLLRLAWLHLEGGVVTSLNTRCRHSLNPWLCPGIDGLLYQQSLGFLGTDFMAACPGQPLIEALLNLACFMVLGERGSNPWFLTGPGMLTLGFARYYRQGLADLTAPPPPGLRLLRESQLCQRVSLNLHGQCSSQEASGTIQPNSSKPSGRCFSVLGRSRPEPFTPRHGTPKACSRPSPPTS